jgi:hypothetical protein
MKQEGSIRAVAAVAWICGFTALAAQPAPDASLLSRIRENMQHRLSDVPNYTCRETVERAEQFGSRQGFRVLDTLQLEVAQVGGRELLARPGEKFEARPISAFASSGLMTNGAFAMQARGLFIGDRATWKYAGERSLDGRKLFRFDFAVPLIKSGYRVKSGAASAVIPYHGFILADPETLDVVRIEIFSDSIAKEIGMQRADMVIEYQPVRIGAANALLPKTAEVITTLRRAKIRQRNRITFSGCRQYGSESVISFASPARRRMVLRLSAPPGIAVQAVVEEDVSDGERVLIPKGARVSGTLQQATGSDRVKLEFARAEWNGGHADFAADPIELDRASTDPFEITILITAGAAP